VPSYGLGDRGSIPDGGFFLYLLPSSATGDLPGGKWGRGVLLTAHPLLLPWVIKERGYNSSPPVRQNWRVTGNLYGFSELVGKTICDRRQCTCSVIAFATKQPRPTRKERKRNNIAKNGSTEKTFLFFFFLTARPFLGRQENLFLEPYWGIKVMTMRKSPWFITALHNNFT
jgi:hypothetical protein